MTNYEIGQKLTELVTNERKATNEILQLINLALEKRSYVELGFSSMFDWLTRGFGYSNAAAYRRIEAAKILRSVPEAASKLETGVINLTILSKTQSVIKAHEKLSGKRLAQETKANLVKKIETKSLPEVERTLLAEFPEAATSVKSDRRQIINALITRHSLNLTQAGTQDLDRAKEVLSHALPNATDSEAIEYALKFFLDNKDPLRKRGRGQIEARRVVLRQSDARCSYQDPITKQVCGSRFHVQLDHIVPKSLGGDNRPQNLRPLCRQHNLLMAERLLGHEVIKPYRRSV
jgi:hypothetical protein